MVELLSKRQYLKLALYSIRILVHLGLILYYALAFPCLYLFLQTFLSCSFPPFLDIPGNVHVLNHRLNQYGNAFVIRPLRNFHQGLGGLP